MVKAKVTIYTREGCHLCEEAKAAIFSAGCADDLVIEEVDIEAEPDLRDRYQNDVPVVFINGIKAFKHRVDAREFRRKLKRAGGARVSPE